MTEHPFCVRPLGNLLSSGGSSLVHLRRRSLGSLAALPDALLVRLLDVLVSTTEPLPAARALCAFSATSTFALAFATDEDLWRRLVFQIFAPTQIASAFIVSWRDTFLALISDGRRTALKTERVTTWKRFVYSDVLFHKWRCQTATIDPYWLSVDNVARVSASETSATKFSKHFEQPGVPVVITDVVENWPAFRLWTRAGLDERCDDSPLHAGGFEFTLRDYFRYCDAVEGHDDQPLYIFDKHFADKIPQLAEEYDVPEYFQEDLFKVLGEQRRPDYRWLIIGPARSGSSFHKDPNATSAWNAVIRGEKKWILFPPDCPPPGVHPSGDGGDVTAPVSITEWFLNFYNRETFERCGAKECIVKEGELIFVPMGWWHCVLNTQTSIAITQNYVSTANVEHVASWLRNRPSQVSGCRSKEQAAYICKNFPRLVVEQFPELRSKLGAFVESETKGKGTTGDHPVNVKKRKTSLWESLQTRRADIPKQSAPGNGHLETNDSKPVFSFGF